MDDDDPRPNTTQLSFQQRMWLKFCPPPEDIDQFTVMFNWLQSSHVLPQDTIETVNGALEICNLQARDIMVPRSQMKVIPYDAPLAKITQLTMSSGHSRFPVIGESRDDIMGILLAKDVLPYCCQIRETAAFNIRDVLRKPIFIPESKRLNVLLKEFRNTRNHMVIVVDEYGGVAGLVTLEDVIEQILGDIDDEHDPEPHDVLFKQVAHRTFAVNARMTIEEFNETFNTDFSDEEYDTIGGLVMQAFGHVPKRRARVVLDGWEFVITWVKKGQIRALRVTLPQLNRPDVADNPRADSNS